MSNLYRDKYLIAVYLNDDYLYNVYTSLKEMKQDGVHCSHATLCRLASGERTSKHIYLIDCSITHDIFEEEDKLFLDFMSSNTQETKAEMAKRLGISIRTLFRRLARQRQKEEALNGRHNSKHCIR